MIDQDQALFDKKVAEFAIKSTAILDKLNEKLIELETRVYRLERGV